MTPLLTRYDCTVTWPNGCHTTEQVEAWDRLEAVRIALLNTPKGSRASARPVIDPTERVLDDLEIWSGSFPIVNGVKA